MAAFKRLAGFPLLASGALLCGCAAQPSGGAPAATRPASSILVSSTPAAGSTVSGPADELILHFDPPARLGEVTVDGPQGLMPMMVTAAGETARYSLPLPGLGPGSYSVRWKAMSRGTLSTGSFSFTVK